MRHKKEMDMMMMSKRKKKGGHKKGMRKHKGRY